MMTVRGTDTLVGASPAAVANARIGRPNASNDIRQKVLRVARIAAEQEYP